MVVYTVAITSSQSLHAFKVLVICQNNPLCMHEKVISLYGVEVEE